MQINGIHCKAFVPARWRRSPGEVSSKVRTERSQLKVAINQAATIDLTASCHFHQLPEIRLVSV